MAATGLDFLTIDAEHAAVDLPQVQQLFQAVRAGNPACAPLARVPGGDYASVKRYVDAGAEGVICPLVNRADQARELVEAVKYPPQGRRGLGFCRDNMYGLHLEERLEAANDAKLVCVQIEHIDGVKEMDRILAEDGVDAVFIGPYDLSASMGIPGQFTAPQYVEIVDRVLAACRRHGVVPGIHVIQPDVEQVFEACRKGYRLVAFSLDITVLSHVCGDAVAAFRAFKAQTAEPGPEPA
jgi:2-dehydro-3-deoxyglucarate aldolase